MLFKLPKTILFLPLLLSFAALAQSDYFKAKRYARIHGISDRFLNKDNLMLDHNVKLINWVYDISARYEEKRTGDIFFTENKIKRLPNKDQSKVIISERIVSSDFCIPSQFPNVNIVRKDGRMYFVNKKGEQIDYDRSGANITIAFQYQ